MNIDVAMGTLGRFQQFKRVIHSLNDQSVSGNMHIYIMDGNEDDAVSDFMAGNWKFHGVTIYKERSVIKEKHWGKWPVLYNYMFKNGKSPLVTYWSDDVYPEEGCFKTGVKRFRDPKVGAVAFSWRDGESKPYKIYGTEMHKQVMVNFGLFRRSVMKEVNFIDEGYNFYNADQDLSLKIWYKNYQVLRCENAKVTHHQGDKSKNKHRGGDYHAQDIQRFMNRWSYSSVKNKSVKF